MHMSIRRKKKNNVVHGLMSGLKTGINTVSFGFIGENTEGKHDALAALANVPQICVQTWTSSRV